MWMGSFASNVGTWMQNVVLPAYVYQRTGSASVVGLLVFAQLGPLLVLSIPAGMIADRFDRRRWLIAMQCVQLVFSVALAPLAAANAPIIWLFLVALGVGCGNALNAPAWAAMLPTLVRPADLLGAISLNSVMINGSRVLGPVIVAVLSQFGVTTAQFFYINAVTYLFVILALWITHLPPHVRHVKEPGMRAFTSGLRLAKAKPVLLRLLVTLFSFSLISLPFVGLFPAVAKLNFGIDEEGPMYKWLYATWGMGACLGGLAIGTVFAAWDQRRVIQAGFVMFAVTLTGFALAREPVGAFTIGCFLGFAYFATTTAMSTIFQSRASESERGRLMALWFVAFGGTITIGNLIFGPIIDAIGARWVLLFGAAWALFLAWWCDLVKLDRLHGHEGGDPALHAGHAAAFDEEGIAAGD
ncbi:MAG: putative major facilitator superfamily transporter [Ilumatobacteraceae bacterium]|nr:putative major facilitator superfamily transporter [Ilumatobacteraceae bacterium]